MKSDIEYLLLAYAEWRKMNSSIVVFVPANLRDIFIIADKLRKADAEKLEQPTT
jgi:hypothetical protein